MDKENRVGRHATKVATFGGFGWNHTGALDGPWR